MIKLFNSLSKQVEDFVPLDPSDVTLYACGPTVYSFAHIGNFRTYMMADMLVRTLKMNDYHVKFIMNLTDVGHLTGDNLGDADTGEDRMEKSAKKEGKTAHEIADFYTEAFLIDYKALHLTKPLHFVKATDNIKGQIDLVEILQEKGFTYTTSDGVYFDTAAFPAYGELSNLDVVKEGARVEVNPEKRNPRDFALWKFSYPHGRAFDASQDEEESRRQMEWNSPWGLGFPGWHIECSAMSMKYLGNTIDIHTGGIDLRETHHPNEIAQSEAATGQRFVNYWLHSAFMLVDSQKMSKSLGNVYRLYDLEKEGYLPVALRYLYLQTHYRQEMNFTFVSLEAAQNALGHLTKDLIALDPDAGVSRGTEYETRFTEAMNNDLNTAEAVAILWELLKSDHTDAEKLHGIYMMDEVLGFGFRALKEEALRARPLNIPQEVREMAEERQQMRKSRAFGQADQMRNKILKLGYEVVDTEKGFEIRLAKKFE